MFYNYYEHLKKIGFEWENEKVAFKYSITLSKDERNLVKKMTMSRHARCKIFNDETLIWNMDVADKKRFHYTTGYLEDHANVLSMFKTKDSKNLRWLSAKEKLIFLSTYSIKHHKDTTGRDIFYSVYNRTSPVLFHGVPSILVYYPRKIQCLFVPKIFHENSNTNFLKELKYIGERTDIDTPGYSEFPNEFGRNLYEYRNKTSDPQTITLTIDDQD